MEAASIFGQGFLMGIVLSLMLGTVFFAIVQNSINLGYSFGILIACGVILSDIIFISLAIWSSTFAVFLKNYVTEVTWIGALLLLLFGLSQFYRKVVISTKVYVSKKPVFNSLFFIGNGFFLNVINPINFFIWLSISTMLEVKFGYTNAQKIVFFSGSLLAIFVTESLVAVFSSKIRRWMSPQRLHWVNKVSGSAFVILSIYLVIKHYFQ